MVEDLGYEQSLIGVLLRGWRSPMDNGGPTV